MALRANRIQFFGAEDGDEDDGSNLDDQDGSTGGEGSTSGSTSSASDLEAMRIRMQAADRNAAAARKALQDAEAKIKEFEDKDKTELERFQTSATEAQAKLADAEQTIASMRLQIAFLSSNDVDWHSPAVALKLLDTSGVAVEDGEVKGMAEAIKKLAADNPYLVKTATGSSGEDESSSTKRKTGESTNGGSGGGSGEIDRKRMEERFPALRGRGNRTT